MKRLFGQWSLVQILGCVLVVGALTFLIWGPGAPDRPYTYSNAAMAMGFGGLALLLVLLGLLFRALPSLAYRERRRPDGFEWRRPPVQRLMTMAGICYVAYLAAQHSDFAAHMWLRRDWLRMLILGVALAGFAAVVAFETRRLLDRSVILSVTADGLTVGDRIIEWSRVEAAVFDRYRWHEFGVVLAGDDTGASREWWFSLRDAGIEAPHFLDRLERAAPQVEVLKPKGEPMAGAHPIPAP